jgi:hypothetical protein
MADIGELKPGDEVDVFGKQNADARHEVAFRVTGVRTYHKTHLPYQQIFDQKSIGRIAIVTCGGPFDASTGNYLDNIVVFAVPMTSVPIGLSGPTPPPSQPSGGAGVSGSGATGAGVSGSGATGSAGSHPAGIGSGGSQPSSGAGSS